MMKKLILLTIAGAVSFGSQAQQGGVESVVLKEHKAAERYKPAFVDEPARNYSTSANKGTGTGGSRWYSWYALVDQGYTGGGMLDNNRFVGLIGWDSTQTQRFLDPQTNQYYYGGVNWISIANFYDPMFSDGFNSPNFYTDPSTIKINPSASYTVDSVFFQGAYVVGTNGSPSTIDTFVLSVAPVPYNDITLTESFNAKVKDYTGVQDNNGELKYQDLGQADANNRHLGNPGVVSWKVPISDTMRKPKNTDGTFQTRGYAYAVPGGLTVPAGQAFAISLAFKPGEAWTAGDSVADLHYFMYTYAASADNTIMPYYYYQYHDKSMSYLMHYSNMTNYSPSVRLEIANTVDFDKEFVILDGKVTCNTCWDLGINNSNTINKFNIYPNPAVNDVTVSYNLYKTADVTISIANAIGQTVAAKTIGNTASGKAEFSVADFANGVYFYTVNADGQSFTRRFVVSH